MKRNCAYCGEKRKKLTKEHIWPKCLIKKTPSYIARYSEKANKVFSGELTTSDVCTFCNNGGLSLLDNYICQLYDTFFCHFPGKNDVVKFNYDWRLLARWLLKISYNSARCSGDQSEVLQKFSEIVLGTSQEPIDIAIFVDITESSPEYGDNINQGKVSSQIFPAMLRCGRMNIPGLLLKSYIVRFVFINAFSFYLAIPRQPNADPDFEELAEILSFFSLMMYLNPEESVAKLSSTGINAKAMATTHFVGKIGLYQDFIRDQSL